ncbi:MAG: deoxyhypusine synthase family protein [Candidatus Poseidoniia archaeon]|jgi:deoxyhypusine synthase|nr:deoxyhypusine synthase family protein [Candidatus Poseidoniia archaeon]
MSEAAVEDMSERRVIPPPMPVVEFTPAQLKRRKELLYEPVRQFRISEHPGTVSLLETMRAGSFQGRQLGEAAALYERMTYEELGIIWSLAGSLFSAGMRQVVIDGIRNGLVDILVCTGALFEQDMLEALGHQHYHCQPTQDDTELQELLIDRVYDHLLDELALRQVDCTYSIIADGLEPGRYSSRAFLNACGSWLTKTEGVQDSVLQAAFEADVPIFVPALNDCSVGVGLVMQQAQRGLEQSVGIDSIRDFHELAELKASTGETGLLIVGGGVPKNYAQDAVVMAEMLGHTPSRHRFGIQLSVADMRDGGLSGSTLREAISWGKNDRRIEEIMVWGEASLAFPLLVAYTYHQRLKQPRGLRRLALHFND